MNTFQNILVFLIFGLAISFLIKKFFYKKKSKELEKAAKHFKLSPTTIRFNTVDEEDDQDYRIVWDYDEEKGGFFWVKFKSKAVKFEM